MEIIFEMNILLIIGLPLWIRSIKLCMLTSFLISLSIELIQLFMNILSLSYGRSVHTEDLILNTLGGIIAWYIFKYTYKGKFKDILNYDKELVI